VRELYVVRHGATAWNENGYCQGRKDVPLSPTGRDQAALLRERLRGTRFDRVFSSPLARARETASIVAGRDPEILPDLNELDRGHWEGHPMDEVKRRWGKLHEEWYRDPSGLAMPGGESFTGLWERAGRVLAHVEGLPEGTFLLVGHKATNRAILARALGKPAKEVWSIPQPQACLSVLRKEGGWSAVMLGDAAHLPEPLRSDR
jgi:broad specificity phosphatase PhoE